MGSPMYFTHIVMLFELVLVLLAFLPSSPHLMCQFVFAAEHVPDEAPLSLMYLLTEDGAHTLPV